MLFRSALIVVSMIAVLEQQQIVMQQGQITSQHQQIALYVSEAQPFANGQAASLVLGQNDFISRHPTTSQSGIDDPVQALFDSSGNLWVLDAGNSRVLQFKPPFSSGMSASLVIGQKSFETSIRSTSKDGFGDPSSPVSRHIARLSDGPVGAAFDSSGNLWVADFANNRVLEFQPPFATGMNASLVIGQEDFVTRSSRISSSGLFRPTEPAFDSLGNLWVHDSGNNRVLEFRPPFSSGMNASLVIGQSSFEANSPSLSQSGLHSLFGDLAIDTSDNLWIADYWNNRVLEFKPPFSNGMNASLVIGQPGFTTNVLVGDPTDIIGMGFVTAFDPSGNLWVVFQHRLLEFKPPFTTNMQASLEIGQPDLTSTTWVGGPNGVSIPVHPGFDSSGNMWVPDSSNNRLLEFVSGFPTADTSSAVQGAPLLGQLQFVGIGTALVIGVVFGAVLIQRWGSRK